MAMDEIVLVSYQSLQELRDSNNRCFYLSWHGMEIQTLPSISDLTTSFLVNSFLVICQNMEEGIKEPAFIRYK